MTRREPQAEYDRDTTHGMLSSSFIHIRGIGPITEQRIWQRGVRDWDTFLANPATAGIRGRKMVSLVESIALSREHLRRGNHRYFSEVLAPREHWRAFPEFGRRIAYLDIETTGTGEHDAITMVGVYDGKRACTYVKDENLQDFAEDIGRFQLLVTFFGSSFDLPFLRRRFPHVRLDQLHIDLCPAFHRLGYKGGLKRIEEQLEIPRSPETKGLNGWDAVRLWREWQHGSREARELLLRYNTEDIVHLETLLEFAYPRLREHVGFPVGASR